MAHEDEGFADKQGPTSLRVDFESLGPLGVPVPVVRPMEDSDMSEGVPEPKPTDPQGVASALSNAANAGEQFEEYLDSAIEQEECDFCESVLRGLKGRPLQEQVKGVRELETLERAMSQGELPDADELAEIVEDFEVVDLGAEL